MPISYFASFGDCRWDSIFQIASHHYPWGKNVVKKKRKKMSFSVDSKKNYYSRQVKKYISNTIREICVKVQNVKLNQNCTYLRLFRKYSIWIGKKKYNKKSSYQIWLTGTSSCYDFENIINSCPVN